jgi:hypothetical protein
MLDSRLRNIDEWPEMRLPKALWIATLLAISVASAVHAERLDREDVPKPLQPWIGWVLHGHDRETCTVVGDPSAAGAQPCVWPSRLELDLDDDGGVFRQEWWVEVKSPIVLPGGATRWPQEVTIDGTPAVVTARDGRPVLELDPGRHVVSGSFEWSELPPLLEIPPQTGLLDLQMYGQGPRSLPATSRVGYG